MANYYVDPTYVGESTGSIDQPFKSWDDVTISSNNNYYMKKGTTFVATQGVGGTGSNSVIVENVLFSTYGEGERPYIDFQGVHSFFNFSGSKNLIIEGYKIENGPGGVISLGASGTRVANNQTVRDCELIGGWRGINSEVWKTQYDADISNILVENCIIHGQGGDGFFCKHNEQSAYDGITIRNCHFYDQNQKWHYDPSHSDGDCIHILRGTNFLIENNILDRRGTSNKFCVAWTGGVIGDEQGIVRNNILYSPYYSNLVGSNAVYFHQGLNYLEFDNNIIIGRHEPSDVTIAIGVMRANTQYVRNNIFDKTGALGLGLNSDNYFGNNLFYTLDDEDAIRPGYGTPFNGKNNIYLIPNGAEAVSQRLPDPSSIVIEGDESDFAQLNFLDLANGDYHPTANSDQLLNKGVEYPWANNVDLDGISVPQGIAREIGPYEYNENATPTTPPPATLMQPLNNAIGVSIDALLKWYPVATATGYKLIFDGNEMDLGTLTSFQLESLDYETVYTWKVIPYNAQGDAENCPTWSFTTEVEEIPTSYIDLTWNFVPDASGYKVSLGTDNPPTNIENKLDVGNTNTYRFENPQFSTTYYWQIIPYNEGGDAENCPVWSFTTSEDGTLVPPSPTTPVYPPDGAVDIPIM